MGLDTVELVMMWEESLSISIPPEVAATLVTPELAAIAISKILTAEGRPVLLSDIERVIKTTTLEISGMGETKYRTNGEFVRYFGLG